MSGALSIEVGVCSYQDVRSVCNFAFAFVTTPDLPNQHLPTGLLLPLLLATQRWNRKRQVVCKDSCFYMGFSLGANGVPNECAFELPNGYAPENTIPASPCGSTVEAPKCHLAQPCRKGQIPYQARVGASASSLAQRVDSRFTLTDCRFFSNVDGVQGRPVCFPDTPA